MLKRFLKAEERYFESNFRDPWDLAEMFELKEAFEHFLEVAVNSLRAGGYSDREIGLGLGGMQQPGVWKRYPRKEEATSGR
jgi:hypothetical protein